MLSRSFTSAVVRAAGVTNPNPVSDRADAVPGYDFLVNSVWPEMIRAVEERLSYLFNPGNPDVFYAVGGRLHPDSSAAAPLSLACRSLAEVQREHGVCPQV